MNNRQLQEAIDKTREFLMVIGVDSGPLYEARKKSKNHLDELEKLQVMRAQMVMTPRVTLGDIQ